MQCLSEESYWILLIPGSNARDDAHFIHMLRNDGDFRDFCGIEVFENAEKWYS